MQTTPTGAPVIDPALRRKAVIGSTLGNAFEWFDFTVYGLFAVVIAKLFFPAENDTNSLLASVASLGVAFFFRPIGGVAFGLYADRAGRKSALSVMVLLMALGTGLIGIAPTYATIGFAAPLLILLARVIQGFSAGGEFGGSTAMLIEFSPPHLRGFYGSFQMCSQALAFSCGALSAYLLTAHLTPQDLDAWGWRIPFLFGILVGPVGWVIRSRIDESPEFVAYLRDKARKAHAGRDSIRSSFTRLFRDYPREMLASLGICVVGTVSAYVFVFFMPIFAKKQLGMPIADVNLATFIGTAVLLVFCPLAGHLSDRYGRKAVYLPGMIAYGIAGYFLFRHFVQSPSFESLLLAQVLISFFMSFFWGPTPITLTEVFPVGVRSTGASITYNVGVLVFGGLAPLFNTWLVKATGSNMAPIYYVMVSVAIGIAGALLLPGTAARLRTRTA